MVRKNVSICFQDLHINPQIHKKGLLYYLVIKWKGNVYKTKNCEFDQ
jgi:hypothetical protein